MDKITRNLLSQISGLHDVPTGAMSFRKNGKSEMINSTKNIVIKPKAEKSGIEIYVNSNCKNESCHMPVVVTENNMSDLVSNDFYISENAVVTIVAGCGLHSSGDSSHSGLHIFHVGKNAQVTYIENHLAVGSGQNKIINTTTKINLDKGARMIMNTTQIGGVDYSERKSEAVLNDDSYLEVNEKILTDRFNVAKTDFKIKLKGQNSKCNIVSRSVAKGESEQVFKSDMIGKDLCYGRVECDAILLDSARVVSQPRVSALNRLATLTHEATVGKIAGEQLIKLMTLGLSEKEAEQKIIEGFLK